jgi:hypothetical protein
MRKLHVCSEQPLLIRALGMVDLVRVSLLAYEALHLPEARQARLEHIHLLVIKVNVEASLALTSLSTARPEGEECLV